MPLDDYLLLPPPLLFAITFAVALSCKHTYTSDSIHRDRGERRPTIIIIAQFPFSVNPFHFCVLLLFVRSREKTCLKGIEMR